MDRNIPWKKNDIIIFNNVSLMDGSASGRQNEASGYDFFAGICSREDQYTFDTEYLKPFVERGSNFKNRWGQEEER